MEFRCSGDGTGSRIEKKLKILLIAQEKGEVVNSGVTERSCNSRSRKEMFELEQGFYK